jgi:hypothetical protein
MKYTTTKNKVWRPSIGEIPKPWIETSLDDHREVVEEHFYDEIKLWDFDICGSETHDFVFDDGKAFRLEYSWWAEWYHDDEEENGLKSEIDIYEISVDEANVPEKKPGRDWLI